MVAVMSKAFESVNQRLTEAIEFSKDRTDSEIIHEFTSIDVKNPK